MGRVVFLFIGFVYLGGMFCQAANEEATQDMLCCSCWQGLLNCLNFSSVQGEENIPGRLEGRDQSIHLQPDNSTLTYTIAEVSEVWEEPRTKYADQNTCAVAVKAKLGDWGAFMLSKVAQDPNYTVNLSRAYDALQSRQLKRPLAWYGQLLKIPEIERKEFLRSAQEALDSYRFFAQCVFQRGVGSPYSPQTACISSPSEEDPLQGKRRESTPMALDNRLHYFSPIEQLRRTLASNQIQSQAEASSVLGQEDTSSEVLSASGLGSVKEEVEKTLEEQLGKSFAQDLCVSIQSNGLGPVTYANLRVYLKSKGRLYQERSFKRLLIKYQDLLNNKWPGDDSDDAWSLSEEQSPFCLSQPPQKKQETYV